MDILFYIAENIYIVLFSINTYNIDTKPSYLANYGDDHTNRFDSYSFN